MEKLSEARIHAQALENYVLDALRQKPVYGLQWGNPDNMQGTHLNRVLTEFLIPELQTGRKIVEIGSGGGRWSRYMIGKVKTAILIDDTWASEVLIKANYPWDGFWFGKTGVHSISAIDGRSVDYAFSYDTFVHFDRPLFEIYLYRLSGTLKRGAKFHLHYAKLYPNHPRVDPECFKYVEDDYLNKLCRSCRFERTGKELEIYHGFGSKLIELVKL